MSRNIIVFCAVAFLSMSPLSASVALLSATALLATPAWSQSSRYSSDYGKRQDQTETLVKELRRLIDEADRAADPVFLRDLRALANRYTNPWRARLVYDDFGDGDYTRSPTWTVTAGEFFVDRAWLVSRIGGAAANQSSSSGGSRKTDAKDVAIGVLATILSNQLGGGQAQSEQQQQQPAPQASANAVIFLPLRITNAFSLAGEISQRRNGGTLELLIYQGSNRSAGYGLYFAEAGNLSLIRRSGQSASVVADTRSVPRLNDGEAHVLEWTRAADGSMTVRIDGQSVIEVIDRGFRDPFDGFTLINRGGEYGLGSLRIDGTS